MRLTSKLLSLIFLGFIILLVIDGYSLVHRGIALFDDDMRSDALLLGHAMKELVTEAWQANGQDKALSLVETANKAEQAMEIRWVWLDDKTDDFFKPRVSSGELSPLARGQEVSLKQERPGHIGYRYTYVPAVVDKRLGALEIAESLSDLAEYTGAVVIRFCMLAVAMALVSWLALRVLGERLVARPLEQLTNMTQRIAEGDLSGRLNLAGKDELANLASTMNRMCEQLSVAREAVHVETEARITAIEQMRHNERLATLGRLSSGVAHELGTPLNVVGGTAKLIHVGDLDKQETNDCSKTIMQQTERMTKIIRQLLDFARRHIPQREPADIESLVKQVFDMLDHPAEEARVILALGKQGDIPLIPVDQSQIQQVLINLVMNGIQAMPDGGQLEVELDVKRVSNGAANGVERDHVVISVRDEGEGMTEENIKLIFEPFFSTKEGRGTGLGLSIVHGIVEEHGGWIDVESEIGTGSCFSVCLPMEPDRG